MAIVRAVATAEDADPRSLDPLGNVLDPAALERVLDGSDSEARVTFSYAGYRVVVTRDAVEVYRRSRPSASGLDPEGEGRKRD